MNKVAKAFLLLALGIVGILLGTGGVPSWAFQTRNLRAATPQTVLADSQLDFSGVQGKENWFYGYYNAPPDSTSFQLVPDFKPGALWFGSTIGPKDSWWFNDRSRWLTITDLEMIPNGEITSGASIPGEKWIVRRWVSTVSSRVLLKGEVFKKDITCGDGLTAHIFVDGVQKWSQFVAAGDSVGVEYSLDVAVATGSQIDFVVSPRSSDLCDTVQFTSVITNFTGGKTFLPVLRR